MTAVAHMHDYAAVVAKYPPRVIHTEAENEYYTCVLDELDARFDMLSDEIGRASCRERV